MSEKVKLNGHAGLLPADRTSKDLYVFLKDAAGNVSAASSKLAVTVDATALVLADDLLTAGYYIYSHTAGGTKTDYIAIPASDIAWDFLNVTAAVSNKKVVGPVGATIAAYDAGGALDSGDTQLDANEKIKVTNGDDSRDYIIKVRAAGPTVTVVDPTNYAYVAGTGTNSVKVMVGGTFEDTIAFVKTGTGGTPSKKPGDYTDAGSGFDVTDVSANEEFWFITKQSGETPASMPIADGSEIVVTAAPSQGTAADDNDEYRLAAITNINTLLVQVDSLYEFQFATSDAGSNKGIKSGGNFSADGWTAGTYNNSVGTTLASMLGSPLAKATHIRLRLKSTIAKVGLTTAWVDAQPPALESGKNTVDWRYVLVDLQNTDIVNAKTTLGTTFTDYAAGLGTSPTFKLFTEGANTDADGGTARTKAAIVATTGVITASANFADGETYKFSTVIGSAGKPDTLPITVTITADGTVPTYSVQSSGAGAKILTLQFSEALSKPTAPTRALITAITVATMDKLSDIASVAWDSTNGIDSATPQLKITFTATTLAATNVISVTLDPDEFADVAGNEIPDTNATKTKSVTIS